MGETVTRSQRLAGVERFRAEEAKARWTELAEAEQKRQHAESLCSTLQNHVTESHQAMIDSGAEGIAGWNLKARGQWKNGVIEKLNDGRKQESHLATLCGMHRDKWMQAKQEELKVAKVKASCEASELLEADRKALKQQDEETIQRYVRQGRGPLSPGADG